MTTVLLRNFEKCSLHNTNPDSLICISLKLEWFARILILPKAMLQ